MANQRSTIHAVFQDAGLLREYVAANYGAVLTHGGTVRSYFRGVRLCRVLARMTKLPLERVVADVRADYELMEVGHG